MIYDQSPMDSSNFYNASHHTCVCRCPCHFKGNNLSNNQHNNDRIFPKSTAVAAQKPKQTAHISFEESYQISDSDSDATVPYNPFRINAPVEAAFSKSFLHVKNIVKHMTARWESMSEPVDDDGSTKRYSLTGRCAGCPNNTANWEREPVDKSDQTKYEWKYKDKVPDNIEEYSYTFEPLQNNKNLSTSNDPLSASSHDQQTYEIQYNTEPANNLFQQESYFADTNSKKTLDLLEEHGESSEETTSHNSTKPVHTSDSTNPFRLMETEKSGGRAQPKVPIPDHHPHHHHHENTVQLEESIKPPRSIQSEVKNIRKSFQDEVDEIVANVNRRSFDSNRRRLSFPDNAEKSVEKPSITTHGTKSVVNIENAGRTKENEWRANIGIASSDRSKGTIKMNEGSVPSVAAVHSVQSRIAPGTMSHSFDEHILEENEHRMAGVKTTLSLDIENPQAFSLRRKSLDNYLLLSPDSQTVTGSDLQESSKRRVSHPSKLTFRSQSQHQQTFMRDHDDGGDDDATRRNLATFKSYSEEKLLPTSDVAIQTNEQIHTKPLVSVAGSNSRNEHMTEEKEIHKYRDNSSKESSVHVDQLTSKHHQPETEQSSVQLFAVEYLPSDIDQRGAMGVSTTKTNKSKGVVSEKEKVSSQKKLVTDNSDETIHKSEDSGLGTLEKKESTYVAYIAVTDDDDDKFCNIKDGHAAMCTSNNSKHFQNNAGKTLLKHMADAALDVNRPEQRRPMMESVDEDAVLASLSKEYDEVVVFPSVIHVEHIGQSISVTNVSAKLDIHGDNNNEGNRQPTPLGTAKRRGSIGKAEATRNVAPHATSRSKREFYICNKCQKIVESSEAEFYFRGGTEIAWHPHCFKCSACKKDLSQADHHFFDEEPYCIEHYVRVANIPKCFKCQDLIFDPKYTSAAGNSWHQRHFTCQACKSPLVDTKYVFVQNKYPYCFQCHAKYFPKHCKSCQGRISPQEAYVQRGNSAWHSNNSCLCCFSCNGSLVGRTLFFRKDGRLYCNRYCAVREM